MKFKYIGADGCYCLELLAYKLQDKSKTLNNGDIVEVPDNLEIVINALDASGNYVRQMDVKSKKVDKGDKDGK